jgi:peptidoglycan/xylan/chitin deacetylase (PgdA/CDA1 family)
VILVVAAAMLIGYGVVSATGAPSAAAVTSPTTVSLTFDDGNADQMTALPALQAAGLRGTFYIISGSVGTPGYLTRGNLSSIYGAGNEIGGHTVSHPDLTTESHDEAMRQICQARNTLTGWGFPQTSFAYPFASVDAQAEQVAAQCGYNSARGLGDIQSRFGCAGCPFAETMPPADPYYLQAVDEVDHTWNLADLQSTVTNAESNGGGWVILTFHHFCSGCDDLGITSTLFSQFTSWLKTHMAATPTTTVKTVNQVMGGAVKPLVTPPPPPAVSGAMTNSSLETVNPVTALPACWMVSSYGANTPNVAVVSPGHTAAQAVRLGITGYANGATQLLTQFDTGECTPSAMPGRSYQVSAWYTSTGTAQFSLYYRNANGGFQYWTSGPYFASAGSWTQATFVTPALPAGATGIAFGVALISNGTVTVDDFGIVDAATLPPAATALGNPSLEAAGSGGNPVCWTPTGFGANSASAARTSDAHTGSFGETVTIASYTTGDIKLLPTLDNSACAPPATPGATYTVSAYYKSTANTQFVLYYRDAGGSWQYWTSASWLGPTPTWAQASFVTPPVPGGATAIAFGLALFSIGTLTTDDYAMSPA